MVVINELELASELAENAVIDEMISSGQINEESEAYIDLGDNTKQYTEEAQDVFNRWYEYFYDKIFKNVI